MIEKTNLELTETVKMLPGKNHSKNPRSKVIFESKNGKENTNNTSIYGFSVINQTTSRNLQSAIARCRLQDDKL